MGFDPEVNVPADDAPEAGGAPRQSVDPVARATAAYQAGNYELAARLAAQGLRANGNDSTCRLLLGLSLRAQGVAAGIEELRRAARIDPANALIRYNLAVSLHEDGDEDGAIVEYEECLRSAPCYGDALWNLGEMLRLREHFHKALRYFDRLVAAEGHRRPKLAHRMAVCCAHIDGMEERARTLFETQLASEDTAATHWEYAHFLLAQGQLDQAWPHYARRFEAGPAISLARRECGLPDWQGGLAAGQLLFVEGEQGAGDEMLFAAYFEHLALQVRQAAASLVIACRPGLVRLFAESFPDIEFIENSPRVIDARLAKAPGQTWRAMMGDLPLHVRRRTPPGYLRAPAQDLQRMKHAVAGLRGTPRGRLVGIVWSANAYSQMANRKARNVPADLLNGYLQECPGVTFVSLQTVEHRGGLAHLADCEALDFSGHLPDFASTAALISQMDEVVSVCTSIANLSAAMGQETNVLLKRHADWRWNGEWFPRARTFRQLRNGDWSHPLEQLVAHLNRRTREGAGE